MAENSNMTCVSHTVLEKIYSTNLNGVQLSIILVVCRFQADNHALSIKFISNATKIGFRNIQQELKELIARKIILITDNGMGVKSIKLNSEVDEWTLSSLLVKEKHIAILNHWNQQGITVHRKLTEDMTKAIDATLKVHTKEEITQAIARYAKVYHDKDYFFKYNWTLVNFLKQKNALPDFLEDGQKWLSYKKSTTKEPNKSQSDFDPYEIKNSWE